MAAITMRSASVYLSWWGGAKELSRESVDGPADLMDTVHGSQTWNRSVEGQSSGDQRTRAAIGTAATGAKIQQQRGTKQQADRRW